MRYVPGEGPVPADFMLIGEAPGEEEDLKGRPFVGAAGYHLDLMLGECQISRPEIRISNVFRHQPPRNNLDHFVTFVKKRGMERKWPLFMNGYVRSDLVSHIHDLHSEIERVRPNCIVAMGRTAFWALTGEIPRRHHTLTDIRGNIFYTKVGDHSCKIIPTFHSSYIMQYAWQDRPIVKHDLSRALQESRCPDLVERATVYHLQPSFTQVIEFLHTLYATIWITIDCETRGGQIACLGVGDQRRVMCIPFMQVEGDHSYWTLEEELAIVLELRRLLTDPRVCVRGQNLLYDCQYIAKRWHFIPNVRQDTIINHHCLWPNPNMYNRLEFQNTLYCEQPRFWKVEGKEWEITMPETKLWNYNCEDVSRTHEIGDTLTTATEHMNLVEQNQFLQDLFMPVLEMMLRGVRVDGVRKTNLRNDTRAKVTRLQDEINYICGHPLNVKSPAQMKTFFYEDMGIKEVRIRSKDDEGNYVSRVTINDEALEKIKTYEPLVAQLVERIQLMLSCKTVLANVLDKDISSDGRVRCSYRIDGTSTYRFASREDAFGDGFNLQNISEGEDKEAKPMPRGLPNLRDMFIPDEGFTMLDGDLEGADARIVAWEANDPWLKTLFKEGADIHVETGRELKLSRPLAKRSRHAAHYGITAQGLAGRIGRTVHEADLLLRRVYDMSPAIGPADRRGSWQHRIMSLCDTGTRSRIGILTNIFGFRYPILERNFYTHALAWVPQSTISITINKILLNIYRHLHDKVELLLQVHDSLLAQTPTSILPQVKPLIAQEAHIVLPYPDDPLVIPFSMKTSERSWGECC